MEHAPLGHSSTSSHRSKDSSICASLDGHPPNGAANRSTATTVAGTAAPPEGASSTTHLLLLPRAVAIAAAVAPRHFGAPLLFGKRTNDDDDADEEEDVPQPVTNGDTRIESSHSPVVTPQLAVSDGPNQVGRRSNSQHASAGTDTSIISGAPPTAVVDGSAAATDDLVSMALEGAAPMGSGFGFGGGGGGSDIDDLVSSVKHSAGGASGRGSPAVLVSSAAGRAGHHPSLPMPARPLATFRDIHSPNQPSSAVPRGILASAAAATTIKTSATATFDRGQATGATTIGKKDGGEGWSTEAEAPQQRPRTTEGTTVEGGNGRINGRGSAATDTVGAYRPHAPKTTTTADEEAVRRASLAIQLSAAHPSQDALLSALVGAKIENEALRSSATALREAVAILEEQVTKLLSLQQQQQWGHSGGGVLSSAAAAQPPLLVGSSFAARPLGGHFAAGRRVSRVAFVHHEGRGGAAGECFTPQCPQSVSPVELAVGGTVAAATAVGVEPLFVPLEEANNGKPPHPNAQQHMASNSSPAQRSFAPPSASPGAPPLLPFGASGAAVAFPSTSVVDVPSLPVLDEYRGAIGHATGADGTTIRFRVTSVRMGDDPSLANSGFGGASFAGPSASLASQRRRSGAQRRVSSVSAQQFQQAAAHRASLAANANNNDPLGGGAAVGGGGGGSPSSSQGIIGLSAAARRRISVVSGPGVTLPGLIGNGLSAAYGAAAHYQQQQQQHTQAQTQSQQQYWGGAGAPFGNNASFSHGVGGFGANSFAAPGSGSGGGVGGEGSVRPSGSTRQSPQQTVSPFLRQVPPPNNGGGGASPSSVVVTPKPLRAPSGSGPLGNAVGGGEVDAGSSTTAHNRSSSLGGGGGGSPQPPLIGAAASSLNLPGAALSLRGADFIHTTRIMSFEAGREYSDGGSVGLGPKAATEAPLGEDPSEGMPEALRGLGEPATSAAGTPRDQQWPQTSTTAAAGHAANGSSVVPLPHFSAVSIGFAAAGSGQQLKQQGASSGERSYNQQQQQNQQNFAAPPSITFGSGDSGGSGQQPMPHSHHQQPPFAAHNAAMRRVSYSLGVLGGNVTSIALGGGGGGGTTALGTSSGFLPAPSMQLAGAAGGGAQGAVSASSTVFGGGGGAANDGAVAFASSFFPTAVAGGGRRRSRRDSALSDSGIDVGGGGGGGAAEPSVSGYMIMQQIGAGVYGRVFLAVRDDAFVNSDDDDGDGTATATMVRYLKAIKVIPKRSVKSKYRHLLRGASHYSMAGLGASHATGGGGLVGGGGGGGASRSHSYASLAQPPPAGAAHAPTSVCPPLMMPAGRHGTATNSTATVHTTNANNNSASDVTHSDPHLHAAPAAKISKPVVNGALSGEAADSGLVKEFSAPFALSSELPPRATAGRTPSMSAATPASVPFASHHLQVAGGGAHHHSSPAPTPAPAAAAEAKEITIMRRLAHRNICPLDEVMESEDGQYLYLVMPYMEKGPVLSVSPNDGTCARLDIDTVRSYMRQILSAVAYLHRNDVAHCDIKPDNILVAAGGQLCLSDFGVSHLFDRQTAATTSAGGNSGGGFDLQQQQHPFYAAAGVEKSSLRSPSYYGSPTSPFPGVGGRHFAGGSVVFPSSSNVGFGFGGSVAALSASPLPPPAATLLPRGGAAKGGGYNGPAGAGGGGYYGYTAQSFSGTTMPSTVSRGTAGASGGGGGGGGGGLYPHAFSHPTAANVSTATAAGGGGGSHYICGAASDFSFATQHTLGDHSPAPASVSIGAASGGGTIGTGAGTIPSPAPSPFHGAAEVFRMNSTANSSATRAGAGGGGVFLGRASRASSPTSTARGGAAPAPFPKVFSSAEASGANAHQQYEEDPPINIVVSEASVRPTASAAASLLLAAAAAAGSASEGTATKERESTALSVTSSAATVSIAPFGLQSVGAVAAALGAQPATDTTGTAALTAGATFAAANSSNASVPVLTASSSGTAATVTTSTAATYSSVLGTTNNSSLRALAATAAAGNGLPLGNGHQQPLSVSESAGGVGIGRHSAALAIGGGFYGGASFPTLSMTAGDIGSHNTGAIASSSSNIHGGGDRTLSSKTAAAALGSFRVRATQCTPSYAAPEALTGATFSAAIADMWSVGVTMFAMLFGVLPFRHDMPFRLNLLIEEAAVPWASSAPTLSSAQQRLVARLVRNVTGVPTRRLRSVRTATYMPSTESGGKSELTKGTDRSSEYSGSHFTTDDDDGEDDEDEDDPAAMDAIDSIMAFQMAVHLVFGASSSSAAETRSTSVRTAAGTSAPQQQQKKKKKGEGRREAKRKLPGHHKEEGQKGAASASDNATPRSLLSGGGAANASSLASPSGVRVSLLASPEAVAASHGDKSTSIEQKDCGASAKDALRRRSVSPMSSTALDIPSCASLATPFSTHLTITAAEPPTGNPNPMVAMMMGAAAALPRMASPQPLTSIAVESGNNHHTAQFARQRMSTTLAPDALPPMTAAALGRRHPLQQSQQSQHQSQSLQQSFNMTTFPQQHQHPQQLCSTNTNAYSLAAPPHSPLAATGLFLAGSGVVASGGGSSSSAPFFGINSADAAPEMQGGGTDVSASVSAEVLAEPKTAAIAAVACSEGQQQQIVGESGRDRSISSGAGTFDPPAEDKSHTIVSPPIKPASASMNGQPLVLLGAFGMRGEGGVGGGGGEHETSEGVASPKLELLGSSGRVGVAIGEVCRPPMAPLCSLEGGDYVVAETTAATTTVAAASLSATPTPPARPRALSPALVALSDDPPATVAAAASSSPTAKQTDVSTPLSSSPHSPNSHAAGPSIARSIRRIAAGTPNSGTPANSATATNNATLSTTADATASLDKKGAEVDAAMASSAVGGGGGTAAAVVSSAPLGCSSTATTSLLSPALLSTSTRRGGAGWADNSGSVRGGGGTAEIPLFDVPSSEDFPMLSNDADDHQLLVAAAAAGECSGEGAALASGDASVCVRQTVAETEASVEAKQQQQQANHHHFPITAAASSLAQQQPSSVSNKGIGIIAVASASSALHSSFNPKFVDTIDEDSGAEDVARGVEGGGPLASGGDAVDAHGGLVVSRGPSAIPATFPQRSASEGGGEGDNTDHENEEEEYDDDEEDEEDDYDADEEEEESEEEEDPYPVGPRLPVATLELLGINATNGVVRKYTEALSLLRGLLTKAPKERLTAADAVSHDFFGRSALRRRVQQAAAEARLQRERERRGGGGGGRSARHMSIASSNCDSTATSNVGAFTYNSNNNNNNTSSTSTMIPQRRSGASAAAAGRRQHHRNRQRSVRIGSDVTSTHVIAVPDGTAIGAGGGGGQRSAALSLNTSVGSRAEDATTPSSGGHMALGISSGGGQAAAHPNHYRIRSISAGPHNSSITSASGNDPNNNSSINTSSSAAALSPLPQQRSSPSNSQRPNHYFTHHHNGGSPTSRNPPVVTIAEPASEVHVGDHRHRSPAHNAAAASSASHHHSSSASTVAPPPPLSTAGAVVPTPSLLAAPMPSCSASNGANTSNNNSNAFHHQSSSFKGTGGGDLTATHSTASSAYPSPHQPSEEADAAAAAAVRGQRGSNASGEQQQQQHPSPMRVPSPPRSPQPTGGSAPARRH